MMTLSSRAPFSRQITRGPGAWRDAIKIQFTMRFPHPPFFELCTARFPFFSFLSGQVTRRSGIGEIGMRNARQEKVNQKVVPFFPFPPHLVEIVLQPQRDIGVKCPWSAVFLLPNVVGREVEQNCFSRILAGSVMRHRLFCQSLMWQTHIHKRRADTKWLFLTVCRVDHSSRNIPRARSSAVSSTLERETATKEFFYARRTRDFPHWRGQLNRGKKKERAR